LAKIQTMSIKEFLSGEYKRQDHKKDLQKIAQILTFSAGVTMLIMPKSVLAAGVEGTFGNLYKSIMTAFDAGVVLVIIFAGAAWALGHRTKAIEILIGVCCGYLLARHAIDIRDFLKRI